jgi:dTDP-L-rhamnose 4-epimerase
VVPSVGFVDVILPTLDEAGALPWVLTRMPPGYRPIVVDNGSTDRSADIAREHGAQVVLESRRGFGAACFAGLLASTSTVVAFMDADASLDPEDLDVVCTPVLDGAADLVMGARAAQPGAWPWHARQANQLLARHLKRRTGSHISDLGPMRAVKRKRLLDLEMTDRGFGWPLEMVVKAALQGWRIEERSVPYRPRIGKSKVSGTVRGTLRAGRDMARILREQPVTVPHPATEAFARCMQDDPKSWKGPTS